MHPSYWNIKETLPHGCNPSREEERQWTGGEGIHSVEWEGEGILAEAKLLPWSDTPDCRGSKNFEMLVKVFIREALKKLLLAPQVL